MGIEKYKVEPLFAEPIFRADISHAISDEQVAYIQNLQMVQNRENLISENLYIFNEPELKSISDAVQESLDLFASEVMGLSNQIYVTQSWSLVNQPQIGMHGHSHSNSVVSGSLYYTDLPLPVAGMIFDKNRTYQQLELTPEPNKQNIFNTPLNIIKPKKGEVVLFSSSLQHYVESNAGTEPRHSIAFNTFIRGKLGNYRDVSELTL
ncbi:MAG: putative 2OG-Fe(II) oxygenase [Pseudomonadota bacterium]